MNFGAGLVSSRRDRLGWVILPALAELPPRLRWVLLRRAEAGFVTGE